MVGGAPDTDVGVMDMEVVDGILDTAVGGGAQDTAVVAAGATGEVDPVDHQEDHGLPQVKILQEILAKHVICFPSFRLWRN